jgi:hypothetical protein
VKGFVKFYTVVTIIQLTVVILSLCVSTLGVVIKHPFVTYFWYLGLFGIGMMLATSFLIGIVLLLTRFFSTAALKGGPKVVFAAEKHAGLRHCIDKHGRPVCYF